MQKYDVFQTCLRMISGWGGGGGWAVLDLAVERLAGGVITVML